MERRGSVSGNWDEFNKCEKTVGGEPTVTTGGYKISTVSNKLLFQGNWGSKINKQIEIVLHGCQIVNWNFVFVFFFIRCRIYFRSVRANSVRGSCSGILGFFRKWRCQRRQFHFLTIYSFLSTCLWFLSLNT
jgi:hypothetical protein